ncbi:hypothetical protein EQH75_06040 [Pseudomonas aeruginosa]|nr:hypothetical protein EQH80_17995 [Pseudomonas aeruginosa]RWY30272.1 hypothetical protein EQH75_06040 [Pseudomonas aeruginosa]RWY89393.1 hypothetical protein EQH73_26810 [Pseudomonas aeruginosa]
MMRCRPSLVRGRAAQVNPGGFTTPARRPSVPHRTAGCGKSSLRPLMAEAVWKRIFTELAIGTPLHSRSLNGVPIFGNVATLKVFCAQSVPLCS